MWPVPTVEALSQFSGRPVSSYSDYAQSALLQATLTFTITTEQDVGDYGSMDPNDQLLANQGIVAYADYIYLRWPYQAAIASPMLNETIGSYSYGKPPPVEMRNVQAQELSVSSVGVPMWDLAVQYLSKRTRAAGVYFGQIRAFDTNRDAAYDQVVVCRDNRTGQLSLLGPADFNRENIPGFGMGINGEGYPQDPGVG